MENSNKYVKIPTSAVIFFCLLFGAAAFYSGSSWSKSKTGSASVNPTATAVFAAAKSDKPQLDFYVMSFCPYGNQMEEVVRPVFDLLKDKADFVPHYIFDKVDDLKSYCQTRSGDPAQCNLYVQNGYFSNETECKKTISDNQTQCMDEKNYLKTENGSMYSSLHGRQEANQNVRELCAWNQVDDKKIWWDFVGNVNKSCTSNNADTCWEEQAKSAGLDTSKITECFNKQAVELIEKEIELTSKNSVQGSPTVYIEDVLFPPDEAYTQDGKGVLQIGKKTATQDQFRSPNVVKEAVCASFNKVPKECDTTLKDLTGSDPGAGACN